MVTVYTQDSLKDLSGEALKDAEGKPVTLGKILINALLSPLAGDSEISGEEKVRRFKLAQRFFAEETVNLAADEVVLLRLLVAKHYGVLVTGQILDWFK